ncbi:MAG: MATE family efflux transporter [Clostridiales bacterium]|nr:MATE family efflux transporter [Clostridiales bacterium]
MRMIRTTLDGLEMGDDSHYSKPVRGRHPLPEGVTNRHLYNDVVRIAWPSLVELLLVQLTSMADLIMVGILGPLAISAVGYTTQPKFMLATVFMALNVGNTAMVARYRGAGNFEMAKKTLRQSVMINFTIGLICSIIGYFYAEPLVRFMGASTPQTVEWATAYLKVQMIGLLSISMTSAVTSALRAVGNSRTPMVYNTVANLVNLVFNYLLIGGNFGFPRWGVAGASIATVMGQVVAMMMAFYVVLKKDAYLPLEPSKGFKPDRRILADIFRIGLPSMLEQVIMRVGVILYTRTVASLGDILMAAHQICMNIQALTFMNGQAFAVSATALVGQSLGRRRGDMAAFYANRTQRVGMFVSFVIGMIIFFYAGPIISLYTDDPIIISNGVRVLRMVAVIQPLQAAQFILAGVLRGAGDVKYTAFITFVTVLIVRPGTAAYAIYVLGAGLMGAWAAMVADQLLRTVLVALRYNTGKWRHKIKASAEVELPDTA